MNIPVCRVPSLYNTVKNLKASGLQVLGASEKATKDYTEADMTLPLALVMGAEGDGMRRLTEENCDFLIRIPMFGSVPCLNVSVATGVCLYEAVRQRTVGNP